MAFPRMLANVRTPPIKCQGIKTKLVNFISQNIAWDGEGRWIEPFLGSGVVLFNLAPKSAVVTDINPHIIRFYETLRAAEITANGVHHFLTQEGQRLAQTGSGAESYYYEVRERFNAEGEPLDFLFLTRACYNGMMRFNSKGGFNVPFCRKPQRFSKAYVTKIANQVNWVAQVMRGKDWTFRCCDWQETLSNCTANDFVYLDPPYIGRHTSYYQDWSEQDAQRLAAVTQALPCGFALSMWKRNRYRINPHLSQCWSGLSSRSFSHFYHLGSTESLRNEMEEALVIAPGFAAPTQDTGKGGVSRGKPKQMVLDTD